MGRGQEMAALHTALECARSGAAGLVLVEGEPGIGKSVLVTAFTGGGRFPVSDAGRVRPQRQRSPFRDAIELIDLVGELQSGPTRADISDWLRFPRRRSHGDAPAAAGLHIRCLAVARGTPLAPSLAAAVRRDTGGNPLHCRLVLDDLTPAGRAGLLV